MKKNTVYIFIALILIGLFISINGMNKHSFENQARIYLEDVFDAKEIKFMQYEQFYNDTSKIAVCELTDLNGKTTQVQTIHAHTTSVGAFIDLVEVINSIYEDDGFTDANCTKPNQSIENPIDKIRRIN